MTTTSQLGTATGDERIAGSELQPSIDALLAMAAGLDAEIAAATDVEAIQSIGTAQSALNTQALALVTAQIELAAGGVLVTAEHINAAAAYAEAAVADIAEWRKKVASIGKVVDFFGAVLTGDGMKILDAAIKLKTAL